MGYLHVNGIQLCCSIIGSMLASIDHLMSTQPPLPVSERFTNLVIVYIQSNKLRS